MIYVGGLRGWGGVGSGAYGTTGELARKINGGGGGGGSGGGDEGRDGMGYKMGEMKFTTKIQKHFSPQLEMEMATYRI